MNGIQVRQSRSLQRLADAFAEDLAKERDAFRPETVMVGGSGLAGWLTKYLTDRNGVCFHVRFVSPRPLLYQVLRGVFPHLPELSDDPYNPSRLLWRIYRLLDEPSLAQTEDGRGLLPVTHPRRRLAMARSLAHAYDDLLLYRPERIGAWEEGEEDHLLPSRLWRAIVQEIPDVPNLAQLQAELGGGAALTEAAYEHLPERFFWFGPTRVAPYHLHLVQIFAASRPVFAYLPGPPGYAANEQPLPQARVTTEPSLSFRWSSGLRILSEQWARIADDWDIVEAPTTARGFLGKWQGGPPLASKTATLQVHVAHSPWREVEVLREAVLDLLDRDPSLEPGDILVLCTDIAHYGPLLEQVFAHREPALPIRCAGAVASIPEVIARLAAQVLALAETPATAREVLDLLDEPVVSRKFSLLPADLKTIETWAAQGPVTQGIDEEHRKRFGLSGGVHSWRWLVDRVVLGLAMPDEMSASWQGLAPLDMASGEEVQRIVQRLDLFVRALQELFAEIARPHRLSEWSRILTQIGDQLTDPQDDPAWTKAWAGLTAEWAGIEGEEELPVSVIREWLQGRPTPANTGSVLPAGGLLAVPWNRWAGVPARVVALVGLDAERFPQREDLSAFDRMGPREQEGDPDTRQDELTRLWMALANASDAVVLTYTGGSMSEVASVPPSAPIQELEEELRQAGEGSACREQKRRPYDPDYFRGPIYARSFSEVDAKRARATQLPPAPSTAPFFPRDFSLDEVRAVTSLEDLVRLLRHPARHILRDYLHLQVVEDDEGPPEGELGEPAGLRRYHAWLYLIEALWTGSPLASEDLTARGWLPAHPAAAESAFLSLREEVTAALAPLRLALPQRDPPKSVALTLPEARLHGRTGWSSGTSQALWTASSFASQALIEGWIRHLYWCALEPKEERHSWLTSPDKTWHLRPVAQATEILTRIHRFSGGAAGDLAMLLPKAALDLLKGTREPAQVLAVSLPEEPEEAPGGSGDSYQASRGPWDTVLWQGRDPDAALPEIRSAVSIIGAEMLAYCEEVPR